MALLIKGDVTYYPSQIKLEIHPDTTYQGQMIMTKITLENNTDSIFIHVPGNSLFHVIENIATGEKYEYKYFGLGSHDQRIYPEEKYTYTRVLQEGPKEGFNQLDKFYSDWNYWPYGDYKYHIKWVGKDSVILSNSCEIIVLPVPNHEQEAFKQLKKLYMKSIDEIENSRQKFLDELEFLQAKYKNSIYAAEFEKALIGRNQVLPYPTNEKLDSLEIEKRLTRILNFIKTYPNKGLLNLCKGKFACNSSVVHYLSDIF